MREHIGLFRGKRIDNGEWVEGYYGVFKGQHDIFVPFTEEEEKQNEGHIFSAVGGLWHEVDPDTVGECCGGLRDKNGKLIFEGDIISIRFESDYEPPCAPDVWYEYAKVIWQEEHLGWYATFEGGDEMSMWEYDNCEDVVVVGTVHDNPELLKGGEEA